jgi:hypothetical protein
VDEINRLPSTKQSLILDGVDRGNWEYLGRVLTNEEHCLFATANFEDRATFGLIAPLKDRFDVLLESRHPGPNLAYMVGERAEKEALLRAKEIEEETFSLLADPDPGDGFYPALEKLSERFRARMANIHGLKLPGLGTRRDIRREMASLPLSEDADCFIRALIAELSFCALFGQKRTGQACPGECRFKGYLCSRVKGCVSNRLPGSIRRYGQGLAWLFGSREAGLEDVAAVAPYALAHRVEWQEDAIAEEEAEQREDALIIHLAKASIEQVLERFREAADLLVEGLARACDILETGKGEPVEGDHPLLREIIRDLELRRGR